MLYMCPKTGDGPECYSAAERFSSPFSSLARTNIGKRWGHILQSLLWSTHTLPCCYFFIPADVPFNAMGGKKMVVLFPGLPVTCCIKALAVCCLRSSVWKGKTVLGTTVVECFELVQKP